MEVDEVEEDDTVILMRSTLDLKSSGFTYTNETTEHFLAVRNSLKHGV